MLSSFIEPFTDPYELYEACTTPPYSHPFLLALRQSNYYNLGVHFILHHCLQETTNIQNETLTVLIHLAPSILQPTLSREEHETFQKLANTTTYTANIRNHLFVKFDTLLQQALQIDKEEIQEDQETLMYNIAELLVMHAPLDFKCNGFRWYLKMTYTIPITYIRANFNLHLKIIEEIPSTQALFAFFFRPIEEQAYHQMPPLQKTITKSGIDIGKQSVHSTLITKKVQETLEFLFCEPPYDALPSLNECMSISLFEQCIKAFKTSQSFVYKDYRMEKKEKKKKETPQSSKPNIFQRVRHWFQRFFTPHSPSSMPIIVQPRPPTPPQAIKNKNIVITNNVNSALQRITIDTTDFAIYNANISVKLFAVFSKVVKVIEAQPSEEIRKELFKRLKEECIEMAGLCSVGHLNRLLNVFDGFDIIKPKKHSHAMKEEIKQEIYEKCNQLVMKSMEKEDENIEEKQISLVECIGDKEHKLRLKAFVDKYKGEWKEEIAKQYENVDVHVYVEEALKKMGLIF